MDTAEQTFEKAHEAFAEAAFRRQHAKGFFARFKARRAEKRAFKAAVKAKEKIGR